MSKRKNQVDMYTEAGEFVNRFESQNKVAEHFNVSRQVISQYIKTREGKFRGFTLKAAA